MNDPVTDREVMSLILGRIGRKGGLRNTPKQLQARRKNAAKARKAAAKARKGAKAWR